MLDLFGSEYGWTPRYVLEQMSRAEVEAMIGALDRRATRRAKAMESIGKGDGAPSGAGVAGRPVSGGQRIPHVDDMTPAQLARLLAPDPGVKGATRVPIRTA